ncbi:MAG: hypothetical protein FWG68_11695 [Defluviitaleaceae bacterium]|nr:hypothetical protein [Defluviitaleaceae bacterium]
MAEQIFVESVELRAASARVGAIIRSMNQINGTIAHIHSNKHFSWVGRAATKDNENFDILRNMTREYLNDVEQTRVALDNAVAEYDRTERTQQQKVSQLSTANVFN